MTTVVLSGQAAVTERGVKADLMNDENSEGGGVMLLGQEQVKGGLVASRGTGLSKTPIAGSARAGREPSVRLAQRQAKREVQSCSSADEVVPGPERPEDAKRKRRDGGGRDSQGFGLAAKRQQHGRDSARLGGDAHAKSREGSSVSSGSSDHEKGHDKYCHFCQVAVVISHCIPKSTNRKRHLDVWHRVPPSPSSFASPSPPPCSPCEIPAVP
jgi:hypothetical protein